MIVQNVLRIGIFRSFSRDVFSKNTARLFKKQLISKSPFYLQNLFYFLIFNIISIAKMEPLKPDYGKKERIINNIELTFQSAITQADELFIMGKFKESYAVLSGFKDSDNVEILWRMSRALYNMTKQKDMDKAEKKSIIEEAYHYIVRAMKLTEEHYSVHKWMAILVDAKSSLESMKSRISTLPLFKKHLLTAIELNPKDATSYYMLGQYMYNIADMSWMQITIAQGLFGTIPEASFEDAFYYFSKAEEVEPNFYSANLLMLGKTCLKLKRIETGRYWLKCATSYPVRTDEDESVRIEAEELLKKIPADKKKLHSKETENIQ